LDLGGTKIAGAIVTPDGEVRTRRELPTPKEPEAVIAVLAKTAEELCSEARLELSELAGVGVGVPGPVDFAQGVMVDPPNLPGFGRLPLGALLGARLGLGVALDNDANAAGLGEARYGAGQGASPLIYLTVSTGIGGAILLDGELMRGASGAAGELGHLVIQPGGPRCGCGGRGCLEAVASGTAIAREARAAIERGEPSLLLGPGGQAPASISAREVAEAAATGDALCQRVLAEAFTLLGLGVASLVNALNPERVVVGGGLSALGDGLLGPIRDGIGRHSNRVAASAVTVTRAALGRDAGVVGAAALAMPKLRRIHSGGGPR
ncbi:MAG: ROK family protein, partial [Polyangia bacterium]|nr:ROK family protein [Polyangia bacterium]